MWLEKKDRRKLMLEGMFKAKHLAALERKDDKAAAEWLKKIDDLKETLL